MNGLMIALFVSIFITVLLAIGLVVWCLARRRESRKKKEQRHG